MLARIGYTGTGYWDGFKLHYDPSTWVATWSLGGSFYWPQFNTQFTLKAEQYLMKEKGVRFEIGSSFPLLFDRLLCYESRACQSEWRIPVSGGIASL